jgi:nitrogenase molybdenum-cofactor synthesis protein NifE
MLSEGTIIIDDANPAELEKFLLEKKVDVMVGGVKERVLAYKLGIGFVDHNHDRKDGLAGFDGAIRFAREVYVTTCSPVWQQIRDPAFREVHS